MTSKSQKYHARSTRLFRPYYFLTEKRHRRETFRSFCDPHEITEFDTACSVAGYGGNIIELRHVADRAGDE
jgi:hypothetical protein